MGMSMLVYCLLSQIITEMIACTMPSRVEALLENEDQ